jgi:cytochrome P450
LLLFEEQTAKPESERRQDMFYFLRAAQNPDSGLPAFDEDNLRAESSLLIIAGSDTTAVSLSSIFFYLASDLQRCQKLTDEIRRIFGSEREITLGSKLQSCLYLKACIDEGMRLTPAVPSEVPREVLPGGISILGTYYPPGVVVGVSPWSVARNNDVFDNAYSFCPERWIVDELTGITKVKVSRQRAAFNPFLSGPTSCVGRKLALAEIMIVVARVLHRFDIRGAREPSLGLDTRKVPAALGKAQFEVVDAFVSLGKGPEVQFRKRV